MARLPVFSVEQVKGVEVCAVPGCVREVFAEYRAGMERLGYCEYHAAGVDALAGDEQAERLAADLAYVQRFQPWRF